MKQRNLKLVATFGVLLTLSFALAQSIGAASAAPAGAAAATSNTAKPSSSGPTNNNGGSPHASGISYTIVPLTGGVIYSATNAIGMHGLDEGTQQLNFPFPVTFYGSQYNSARVSVNGNLQFGSNHTPDFHTYCLPYSQTLSTIFTYWDDLDTFAPGDDIYTDTLGTAPNRTFIIEWRAARHDFTINHVHTEIALYESDNIIRVYYGVSTDNGAHAVAGVQEGDGQGANSNSEYTCNGSFGHTLSDGLVVQYVPIAAPTPTPTPTDCPNPFTDISGNLFYGAIHNLYCRGVVNGTGPTTFSPNGTSTRGQFAKVVVLGFGVSPYTPSMPDFTDVQPVYFAYSYIEAGFHAGILGGFDSNTCTANGAVYPCYLPNKAITRGQVTKLVVGAAHYALVTPVGGGQTYSDVPPSNVFYLYIETAHAKNVVNGFPDGTFRPNANIQRDQMAQIVYKGMTTP